MNRNFESVAHQGYAKTGKCNMCKLNGYVEAARRGFTYGECDLKFSMDGIAVCCHDETFVSKGETVRISEHTWAELQTYDYYGETIASFEQVLRCCKQLGLGLYLDHIHAVSSPARWNTVFEIIKKYNMEDHVKWLVGVAQFDTFPKIILDFYSGSKISLVTGESDLSATIAVANSLKTDVNDISIDALYKNFTTEQVASLNQQLSRGVSLELWTIDDTENYTAYLPYVSAITSNKICYNDVREELLG